MPGETSQGYRTMLDSDPMADVAQAIRNLAQDVDNKAGVLASGTLTVHVAAAPDGTDIAVFPAGRFSSPPNVVTTARGDTHFARPGTTTPDQVTIKVISRNGSSSTGDIDVDWIAHQG